MNWLRAAVVIAATLISGSALSASVKSPPGLQNAADCMYGILKKEPGFEKAKLGVAEDTGFAVPYIQYLSPPDKFGRRITVTFVAQVGCEAAGRNYNCNSDKDRYTFMAVLGGIFGPTYPGPPDGDVGVLEEKWKAACGVNAYALFV